MFGEFPVDQLKKMGEIMSLTSVSHFRSVVFMPICAFQAVTSHSYGSRDIVNSLRPWNAYMRRQSSHQSNQCADNVNWNLKNKRRWNRKRNSCNFIQENAFQNAVCEMGQILLISLPILEDGICQKTWHGIIDYQKTWKNPYLSCQSKLSLLMA